jgi:thiosulfate/3-mercaptopyruvate sulfurtransferase
MLRSLKWYVAALFVSVLLAQVAAAQGVHGQLVSVQWLNDNLKTNKNLVMLDASPTKFYAEKHVPGAVSVSFTPQDAVSQGVNLSYGGGIDLMSDTENAAFAFQDRPVPEMQALFREWGISRNSQVVIYDQGGAMHATRLFFSLFYYGFPLKNLHILDGGMAQWSAKKLPVSTTVDKPAKAGDFSIEAVKSEFKTNVNEMLAAAGDTQANALVEALGADWHFGEALNYNRRGHIPYAIMAPAADFYNADKTFKSPDEVRRMLKHLGVSPEQNVFTHCGGGIAGSVAFFATKFIADYPKVKHSTESQLGWLNDARDLPFWTYDAPYILRDSDWLQWWGGQRTRSLGSIQVSVVDVRSPADYKEAHLPFALNVPAATFREQLKTPAALRPVLGAAGVNPAHEAVIVSGNGIDKDSALAYVLLESLGQKKVSILSDSLDQWAAKGFQLRDTPTVVAPKAKRYDLAVPPVQYASSTRDEVLITDAARHNGLYPKVFLASGAKLPAQALDGKVVHVPYTALLQEDGTPKAAAAIWSTLQKAGVSRYSELVTVSDDAGEAAANYVVLKLMGYPNIKTLAR